MSKFTRVTKGIQKTVIKYSPEILTVLGTAGLVSTVVMAVSATPKAMRICNDLKEDHREANIEEPTKLEYVKATWKCYIPSAVTGVVSVCCIVGASNSNRRRNAALATAYTLTETAFKDYKDKVVETLGEKKDTAIREAIAKDKITKNPPVNREIIVTEKGNTMCFDSISGRYFKSDIDKLRRVENAINRRLLDEMYVSLNDFYYEIGLKPIAIGDDIGWNVANDHLELHFSSLLAEDDSSYEGTPCLVIEYGINPRFNYNR